MKLNTINKLQQTFDQLKTRKNIYSRNAFILQFYEILITFELDY
jgi:hypothetical protein